MSDSERTLWWGEPHDARAFHIFEGKGSLSRSLCGNWMMGYGNDLPEVDLKNDSYKRGRDCKACSTKADIANTGSDS